MRIPLLAILLLAACTDPVAPPVPAELTVLHGPGAVSVPGQRFDTVSIRLTAADGTPIVGWPVTWTGDGTIEPIDSVTDELGFARATWTLPRYPRLFYGAVSGPSGHYTAHATALGGQHSVGFTVDAHAFMVDDLDAASHYACGIRDGELWCWGYSDIPLGHDGRAAIPFRVELPAGMRITGLRTGRSALCVLDDDGLPWCHTEADQGSFRRVPDAPPLRSLDGESDYHPSVPSFFCGRDRDAGRAWCWTITRDGVAFGGFVSDRAFTTVVAGRGFGCGLAPDGVAWCWGRNDYGQLGNGTIDDTEQPSAVVGDHHFVGIAAKALGACGSTANGQVWCWGWGPPDPEVRIPERVTVPGVVGPDIRIGGAGEGHAIVNGVVHTWYADIPNPEFSHPEAERVLDVVGDGQSCLLTRSAEVYCSFRLMGGSTASSPFTADVVPVPDPATVSP